MLVSNMRMVDDYKVSLIKCSVFDPKGIRLVPLYYYVPGFFTALDKLITLICRARLCRMLTLFFG